MPYIITSKQLIHNENAVYYFQKKYTIKEKGTSIIKIFADTRYKLYINQKLVAVGPCKPSSEIRFYDEVDISEYIKEGENTFSVTVLQLGNSTYPQHYTYMESIMRSGSMCLGIWGNAGDTEIVTDESWSVTKEKGLEFFFEPEYKAYNVAALCEKITPLYKKLQFENAIFAGSLYDMENKDAYSTELVNPVQKRTIPMMYFKNMSFKKINNNIFDAGKVTCGYIKMKCKGNGIIKLTYAECMAFEENGQIIKKRRDDEKGLIIGDYDIVEVCGECVFEPFWMRTFRYVKVEFNGDLTIENFDYIETGYPIHIFNNYDFGNDYDNKLFEISVNTLRCCMHESYVDCPYYEQLQYTMDTHLQILFTYQLSTDKRLAEKAIDDFSKSYRAGGITQSRYPVNKAQFIPGFSLFFILMLFEHFKRFNNISFIKKYIPIADGIIDWFIKRLDGYMVPRSNLWDFIDWAEEYDKDTGTIPSKEPITVYSLMLAYALEKLSDIYNSLGVDVIEYRILANKIKENVRTRAYDEEKGLYADSPEKSHYSQHPQIWAVLCGMETGRRAKNILVKSMDLDCKASFAYMFYMFRALEKADIYELADEYIKELRFLVELGCTTTPECTRDDVRSECHAWSAVAIYEFTAKVLGVIYKEQCVYVKPYIVGRKRAKGYVATPKGMVYIEWKIDNDIFTINIDVPSDVKVEITMPNNNIFNAQSGVYTCKII